MLRKENNFKNFLNDKIVNLADSSKESIIYSNRIFGEFCEKTHGKTMDEVITEARKDEFPDNHLEHDEIFKTPQMNFDHR